MITLPESLAAWPGANFAPVLKKEILSLDTGQLPLEQGLTQGGVVDASTLDATVLAVIETDGSVSVKVGFFYAEVVGGCNCNDDPVAEPVYCEFELVIERQSGQATFLPVAP